MRLSVKIPKGLEETFNNLGSDGRQAARDWIEEELKGYLGNQKVGA